MFTALGRLLSPPSCAACSAELRARTVFCVVCARAVIEIPDARVAGVLVVAGGAYGGPLADAVRRLKFGDRPDLASPLGDLLRAAALRAGLEGDVVLPVPLHPRRLVHRGYNQAALLARRAVRSLGAPLNVDALERKRGDRPQVELSAAARAANVEGAFVVRRPCAIEGRRVIVIDDVVTTGATAKACADALRAAGATTVTMLALARVP